jgi:16S rRNA processing protein RimM
MGGLAGGQVSGSEPVTIGRIVRPHGLKGDVVVESATDFAETRFRKGATVATRDGRKLTIAASRPQGDRWVVRFAGLESIEAVDGLRDTDLQVEPDALGALPAGQYYLHDLVGCVVQTEAGETVGAVATVYTGAAQAVLGIEGVGGEILVPMAEGICREVDVAAKRIVIAPPEGLLDVNR